MVDICMRPRYDFSMNNNEAIITRTYSQDNMDYAHGEALTEDAERGAAVVTTTTSGLVITRAMIDAEIRAMRQPRTVPATTSGATYFPGWHGLAEVG